LIVMMHAARQLPSWLIFDVRQGRARIRTLVRQPEEGAYSVQGIPTYNLDANDSKENTRGLLGFVLEFDRPQGKGAKRSLKPPGDATAPRKIIVMRRPGSAKKKMPVDFESDIAFHLLCDRTAEEKPA
jgi:hypothetical protein